MNTMEREIGEDRYGDPFVRILELYILKAIGSLTTEDDQAMKQLTPELQSIYGINAGWLRIVEEVMEFPREAPDEIRSLWLERKKEVAETEGRRLYPEEFAREFADQCFDNGEEEE